MNDSPYERILAIGDVHAAYDKLQSLWKKLNVTDKDLVIFLGDYLYGLSDGNKNVETLHGLIEHKQRKNIIFLRGNIDEIYIHNLFDSNGNFFYRLDSRVARAIKTASLREPYFPQEIHDFLTGLPLYHCITIGGRKYFFCHAGIKVEALLNAQPKSYLLNHPKLKNFYRGYSGNTVIVVGHKSPKKIFGSSEKYDLNFPLKIPGRNILMLDTGAKEDGQLSCVDILSGEFWQSNENANAESIDSVLFVCSGNTCRSPMAKYIMRHLLKQNDFANELKTVEQYRRIIDAFIAKHLSEHYFAFAIHNLEQNGFSIHVDHRTLKAQKEEAERNGDTFLARLLIVFLKNILE